MLQAIFIPAVAHHGTHRECDYRLGSDVNILHSMPNGHSEYSHANEHRAKFSACRYIGDLKTYAKKRCLRTEKGCNLVNSVGKKNVEMHHSGFDLLQFFPSNYSVIQDAAAQPECNPNHEGSYFGKNKKFGFVNACRPLQVKLNAHNSSCKRMHGDIRQAAEQLENDRQHGVSYLPLVTNHMDPYDHHSSGHLSFVDVGFTGVCWQLCMWYICICCDYQLTFVPGKGSPRRMAKLVSEVGFQNSSNRSGHMISNCIGIILQVVIRLLEFMLAPQPPEYQQLRDNIMLVREWKKHRWGNCHTVYSKVPDDCIGSLPPYRQEGAHVTQLFSFDGVIPKPCNWWHAPLDTLATGMAVMKIQTPCQAGVHSFSCWLTGPRNTSHSGKQ